MSILRFLVTDVQQILSFWIPFYVYMFVLSLLTMFQTWFEAVVQSFFLARHQHDCPRRIRLLQSGILCIPKLETHEKGISIRPFPGLVNFFPAVAYLICLNLSAAFWQPGNRLIEISCKYFLYSVLWNSWHISLTTSSHRLHSHFIIMNPP